MTSPHHVHRDYFECHAEVPRYRAWPEKEILCRRPPTMRTNPVRSEPVENACLSRKNPKARSYGGLVSSRASSKLSRLHAIAILSKWVSTSRSYPPKKATCSSATEVISVTEHNLKNRGRRTGNKTRNRMRSACVTGQLKTRRQGPRWRKALHARLIFSRCAHEHPRKRTRPQFDGGL